MKSKKPKSNLRQIKMWKPRARALLKVQRKNKKRVKKTLEEREIRI